MRQIAPQCKKALIQASVVQEKDSFDMDQNGTNADKNKEMNWRNKYEVISTDLADIK